MVMPYIENRQLRISGMALLFVGLLSLVGYLFWIKNSGETVATATPVSANVQLGTWISRPMLDISTRQEGIVFSPITLTPEMGDVRLDIHLTQTGFITNESGIGTQSFSLINTVTGEEVFQKKDRGMLRVPASTDKIEKAFTIKNSRTHVATLKVPASAPYVLSATLEKWILASPHISMTLVAKTGAVSPNAGIVVIFSMAMLMGILLCWVTTPPHLRNSKAKTQA